MYLYFADTALVKTDSLRQTRLKEAGKIVLASLFLALCAQISIPLFFTPVPLSLQTLAVLLIGATLGKKSGALAVVAYLLEGACGLPVFAGGLSGAAALLGPRGGYLLGFVVAAYLIGLLFEKNKVQKRWSIAGVFVLGNLSICACGVAWISYFVGIQSALVLGFYPFILGDLLKITVATLCLSKRSSTY